jgi:hypothetical protein
LYARIIHPSADVFAKSVISAESAPESLWTGRMPPGSGLWLL